MQEMRVPSLGLEDPLEKEMATHSSMLAWEIGWTEDPGELQSRGLQRVSHDLVSKQQQFYLNVKRKSDPRKGRIWVLTGNTG